MSPPATPSTSRPLRDAVRSTAGGFATLELEGTGTVELDREQVDGFGDPLPRVSLEPTERDRRTVARCREALEMLGETLEAKKLWADAEQYLGWGAHPSGACPMGQNPDEGVCD